MKVSQKRNEIQSQIDSLKFNCHRLETDLIPNSKTTDERKCREDHKNRAELKIIELNEILNLYENYQSDDEIITSHEDGAIIVLSEGFEVENTIDFNLSVMNEIECGEGDYYRERIR